MIRTGKKSKYNIGKQFPKSKSFSCCCKVGSENRIIRQTVPRY